MTKQTINPTLSRILLLAGLVAIYIIGCNFFVSQILATTQKISTERQTTATLRQKAAILADSSGSIINFTDGIILALPQSDPSLAGISQIKAAAATSGVTIDNISYSVGSQIGTDVHKISFGVDVSGTTDSFRSFLAYLKKSAPISTVSNLRLSQQTTTGQLSISLSYYWSPLPAQLPELEKPLGVLSAEDLQLLSELATLTQPAIGSPTDTSTVTTPRQNIFELSN